MFDDINIKKLIGKFKAIYQFLNEDDIKEALKDVDISLNKPFSIFYAIDDVCDALKKRNYSKEDLAKLELNKLASKSAKDTLDLLKIDYRNGGIAYVVKELELIDSFKNTEWNNYILSIPAIIEFKEKFSSLLKEYNYPYEQFNLLFDRLLLKNVKDNPTILELNVTDEIKELTKYLYHVINLMERENPIDKRPLADYYIPTKLTKVKHEWSIEELVNAPSTKWYEVIASDFGTGKSSYAYYIASKLAKDHLDGKSSYIPILVELNKSNLDNDFRNVYEQLSLDDVLGLIGDKKVLLIFDGLDEYGNAQAIRDSINKYKKNKVLITTRLIKQYIKELGVDTYINVEPFSKEQVDQFFKKYGVDLTYEQLERLGLSHEEISKPLFAWMLAFMYNNDREGINKIDPSKLELDNSTKDRVIRTILYHNFIHGIIRGKYVRANEEWLDSYKEEKRLLRIIDAIHNIYGKVEVNDDKELHELVSIFDPNIKDIEKHLKLLTDTYFYTSTDRLNSKKSIEFMHKSFQEYFLAEYYYANIKSNSHKLNVGLPSEKCI